MIAIFLFLLANDKDTDKQEFSSIATKANNENKKKMKSKGKDSEVEMHFGKKKNSRDINEHSVTDAATSFDELDSLCTSELSSHDYRSCDPPKKPLQSKTRQGAAVESTENLSFSKKKNYSPPYLYNLASGGNSTHTNRDNEIDEYFRHHVLEKHGQKGLHVLSRKLYRVYLHCSKEPRLESPSRLSWCLFFSMVRNISTHEKSVNIFFRKSQSPIEQVGDIVVQFNEGAQHMEIVINNDQLNHQRGWSMHKVVPTSINKYEVDNYVKGCPPHFKLLLTKNVICYPCDLTYKFVLYGVGDNEVFITIHKFATEHKGKLFREIDNIKFIKMIMFFYKNRFHRYIPV